jgi:hypothetical protein
MIDDLPTPLLPSIINLIVVGFGCSSAMVIYLSVLRFDEFFFQTFPLLSNVDVCKIAPSNQGNQSIKSNASHQNINYHVNQL